MFVALAAGVFGLLPRLGGLSHDAAALRHARPAFVAVAIVVQAASLGFYALLYRRVLASLGARVRFRLAVRVTMASFLVSHLTPFGSAAGALVNVSALEPTAWPHPRPVADRAGRRVAGLVRHVRPGIDPGKVARTSRRLASLARSALTGRAFTPGGLGVIEVTLVAVTVGFGAPRPTAVLAVLGYRIVNYWLPLLPGAVAYIRLRLSPKAADRADHPDPSPG
jgi:uncharacterized membrane protein YbhN (UPF0104 family)